jgi:hypothetical protein
MMQMDTAQDIVLTGPVADLQLIRAPVVRMVLVEDTLLPKALLTDIVAMPDHLVALIIDLAARLVEVPTAEVAPHQAEALTVDLRTAARGVQDHTGAQEVAAEVVVPIRAEDRQVGAVGLHLAEVAEVVVAAGAVEVVN